MSDKLEAANMQVKEAVEKKDVNVKPTYYKEIFASFKDENISKNEDKDESSDKGGIYMLTPFGVQLRERLQHEDTLINQRFSWLLVSQAFLLTAFAGSFRMVQDPFRLIFLCFICFIGAFMSGAIGWSLFSACNILNRLAKMNVGIFSGPLKESSEGNFAVKSIPIVFAFSWVFLLLTYLLLAFGDNQPQVDPPL